MIALARQTARAAHDADSAKLAEARRQAAFAGNGRIVRIELHVAGNEKIEPPVAIVVAPGRAGGPAAQRDSGLFGNVGEGAIVIVVVEPVLAEIRNVEVRPAVVIVVADGNAKSPALVGHAGLV